MKMTWAEFGDAKVFQISVRWAPDSEPRERMPLDHGWSIGDLRIVIGGQTITKSKRAERTQDYISWYLAPVLDWMATNWAALLHEEDITVFDRTGAPAAVACPDLIYKYIDDRTQQGLARYAEVQQWYRRHAIRSAAEGGLFPDIYFRRYLDEIEISWASSKPLFSPNDFSFTTDPGFARLSVRSVAEPLLELLEWAAKNPPSGMAPDDIEKWRSLSTAASSIRSANVASFEERYVEKRLLDRVKQSLRANNAGWLAGERSAAPYLEEFSPAVAMFGGANPELSSSDIDAICEIMISSKGIGDNPKLAGVVPESGGSPLNIPHQDGYRLASELLDDLEGLGVWDPDKPTDLMRIAQEFGIAVSAKRLDTETIRGVAIAGEGFSPSIIINEASPYNSNNEGVRFTLAHELCHVIHDRTRARRVTHISGQWVAPGIEKRANAFAAYLLMPRELIAREFSGVRTVSLEAIQQVAEKLEVSQRALVEHLYNMDLISDSERAKLRNSVASHF